MTRLRRQPTVVVPAADLALLAEHLRSMAVLVDDLAELGRAVEVEVGSAAGLFVPRIRALR